MRSRRKRTVVPYKSESHSEKVENNHYGKIVSGNSHFSPKRLFQKGKGHHHFKIHKMRATIHPLKNELADRRGKEQTQWPNNNLAAGGRPNHHMPFAQFSVTL